MIRNVVRALPAVTLFAILCIFISVFGGGLVDVGNAVVVEPEDRWSVYVSLVEGPISWSHSVESKWIAERYVNQLERDELLGGYWIIYRDRKEYAAGRWYKHE